MPRPSRYPYEVRVAACADYLIGRLGVKVIARKHGIENPNDIVYWVRRRGCFKLRKEKGTHQEPVSKLSNSNTATLEEILCESLVRL